MNEPPAAPGVTAPPTHLPPPPVQASLRRRPPRWPWIVTAVVIAAIVGVAVWWLIATTVPESTYDEATAKLEAAEADVSRLEQQVASLEDEVAELEEQVASLEADNQDLATDAAALRDAAALALAAAEAQAHDALNTGTELPAELEAAGADFTDADALLGELGHEGTLKDWAAQDEAFYATDRAMAAVDDDRLWDAWERWYDSEPGSPQEQAAYFEYLWRLHRLVVEALGDMQE